MDCVYLTHTTLEKPVYTEEHVQTSSGNQASMTVSSPQDPKKKNALTKESEYGVLGIKTPLLEVSAKAEEVWGPALGGREKEANKQEGVAAGQARGGGGLGVCPKERGAERAGMCRGGCVREGGTKLV